MSNTLSANVATLETLRTHLLDLHKTLVDSERAVYERSAGTIPSAGAFLQLLTTDPWFAWLRELSQLVTLIDETVDDDEPVTDEVLKALVQQAKSLTRPDENGEGYAKNYSDALHRDPDVAGAHADTVRYLNIVHKTLPTS